jgi:hypothetical protein
MAGDSIMPRQLHAIGLNTLLVFNVYTTSTFGPLTFKKRRIGLTCNGFLIGL